MSKFTLVSYEDRAILGWRSWICRLFWQLPQ